MAGGSGAEAIPPPLTPDAAETDTNQRPPLTGVLTLMPIVSPSTTTPKVQHISNWSFVTGPAH